MYLFSASSREKAVVFGGSIRVFGRLMRESITPEFRWFPENVEKRGLFQPQSWS
jgi:hypothetical protein